MIPSIAFKAHEPVRRALSEIGRTEDLRFSPDNRRIALAGYFKCVCLILDVEIVRGPDGPEVLISDHIEISSPGITQIHGIDFVDDQTLAIANRDGVISVIRLPEGPLAARRVNLEPVRILSGENGVKLRTPGSLAVQRSVSGRIKLLVCNNYTHNVTEHVLDGRGDHRVLRNRVLVRKDLNIPDGIAVSHDRKWIAVSSHGTNDVKMFRSSWWCGKPKPVGALRNANYPHGLRFTQDDAHVLVADAGGPVVHVYERGQGWGGERDPARSIEVLDADAFQRGRINVEEGGPKGIDIDKSNQVVAITCQERTLAFFELKALLGR